MRLRNFLSSLNALVLIWASGFQLEATDTSFESLAFVPAPDDGPAVRLPDLPSLDWSRVTFRLVSDWEKDEIHRLDPETGRDLGTERAMPDFGHDVGRGSTDGGRSRPGWRSCGFAGAPRHETCFLMLPGVSPVVMEVTANDSGPDPATSWRRSRWFLGTSADEITTGVRGYAMHHQLLLDGVPYDYRWHYWIPTAVPGIRHEGWWTITNPATGKTRRL